MIKDSGERRKFESGAVRDIQEGKGRCDLLPLKVIADFYRAGDDEEIVGPLEFIDDFIRTGHTVHLMYALYEVIDMGWFEDEENMFLEVAKHFEDGAEKYGDRNWEKGIPVHCYIDSAVRHYLKHINGQEDERHDRAFVWNIICAIWTYDAHPELNDMPKPTKVEAKGGVSEPTPMWMLHVLNRIIISR